MLNIEIGGKAVDRLLKEYPKLTTRAMVRAMNRAIQGGRTVMVRAIAQDMGTTQSAIRAALTMREATLTNPEAKLAAPLKRLPISAFKPVQRRGGVSYRLRGGKGQIPNAFIATMPGGHPGVFARKGKTRLPIRELFGPSIGHVFGKHRDAGIERVRQIFRERFDHEMAFARKEAGGE